MVLGCKPCVTDYLETDDTIDEERVAITVASRVAVRLGQPWEYDGSKGKVINQADAASLIAWLAVGSFNFPLDLRPSTESHRHRTTTFANGMVHCIRDGGCNCDDRRFAAADGRQVWTVHQHNIQFW